MYSCIIINDSLIFLIFCLNPLLQAVSKNCPFRNGNNGQKSKGQKSTNKQTACKVALSRLWITNHHVTKVSGWIGCFKMNLTFQDFLSNPCHQRWETVAHQVALQVAHQVALQVAHQVALQVVLQVAHLVVLLVIDGRRWRDHSRPF